MEKSDEIIDPICSCNGKNLDRLLQPSILLILMQTEMHGFLLIQKLSESPMFTGIYPDPTGLYRYLKKMEHNGLLSSRKEDQEGYPSKRIYQITDLGKECLSHWRDTLMDYQQRIHNLTESITNIMNLKI